MSCSNAAPIVSWIGLTDHVSEGTFEWVTGEAYSYENFCSGEPNNAGNEDYVEVMISSGCWNGKCLWSCAIMPFNCDFTIVLLTIRFSKDINLAGYNNVDKFVVEFDNVPASCPDLRKCYEVSSTSYTASYLRDSN